MFACNVCIACNAYCVPPCHLRKTGSARLFPAVSKRITVLRPTPRPCASSESVVGRGPKTEASVDISRWASCSCSCSVLQAADGVSSSHTSVSLPAAPARRRTVTEKCLPCPCARARVMQTGEFGSPPSILFRVSTGTDAADTPLMRRMRSFGLTSGLAYPGAPCRTWLTSTRSSADTTL